mgnify:CR=1 FL=1
MYEIFRLYNDNSNQGGYEAYINNLDSLGIGTTVGGIILMKVPFLGTGATLIGGGITYLNEKNDIMYKNLVDALVKGKYNIVIKNNELNFKFYLKDNFEFSSWNKKKYVSKYSYNTRLQVKEIEKIEIIERN